MKILTSTRRDNIQQLLGTLQSILIAKMRNHALKKTVCNNRIKLCPFNTMDG